MYDTLPNIISDALIQMGVLSTAVANPFASTDPNIIQAVALLKALGRRLARAFQWSALQKTHTFSTVAATASYALPADFHRLLPATEWNRTTEQRLGGPMAAQGWQVLQSTSAVAGITYFMRKVGNKIHLYPVPTATETIAYEYQSDYWVVPTGETAPTSSAPAASTDTLWFDSVLLVAGLKLAWRNAKRMDSAAEQNDYTEAWNAATGGDHAAPDLTLGGFSGAQYMGEPTVPETGYGA